MLYTWHSTVFESVWIFQYLQCIFIIDINSTCLHTNHRNQRNISNLQPTSLSHPPDTRSFHGNTWDAAPGGRICSSRSLSWFCKIHIHFWIFLICFYTHWFLDSENEPFKTFEMRLVSGKKHLVQSIEDSSIPCLWLCTTTNDAKASSIYWVCSGQKKIEQVRNIVRLYVVVIESSVSVASPWIPVVRTKPMVELLMSLESLRLAMSTTRSSDLQALYPWSTDVYINFVCLRIIIITSCCIPFRSWNWSLCS